MKINLAIVSHLTTLDEIREDFVGFLDISERTTGEQLSTHRLNYMTELGLDLGKMRSQCDDGGGKFSFWGYVQKCCHSLGNNEDFIMGINVSLYGLWTKKYLESPGCATGRLLSAPLYWEGKSTITCLLF